MPTASPMFNHSAETARQSGERLLAELQRSQDDISAATLLNMTGSGVDYSVTTERGETPLLLAAQKGFYLAAAKMVSDGADVNTPDQFGFTPLMMAASGGDIPLTDALIAKGARTDARSAADDTALSLVADQGLEHMLKHLIAKGLPVSEADVRKSHDRAVNKGFDGVAKIFKDIIDARARDAQAAVDLMKAAQAATIATIAAQFTHGTGDKVSAPKTARFHK